MFDDLEIMISDEMLEELPLPSRGANKDFDEVVGRPKLNAAIEAAVYLLEWARI